MRPHRLLRGMRVQGGGLPAVQNGHNAARSHLLAVSNAWTIGISKGVKSDEPKWRSAVSETERGVRRRGYMHMYMCICALRVCEEGGGAHTTPDNNVLSEHRSRESVHRENKKRFLHLRNVYTQTRNCGKQIDLPYEQRREVVSIER